MPDRAVEGLEEAVNLCARLHLTGPWSPISGRPDPVELAARGHLDIALYTLSAQVDHLAQLSIELDL